MKTLAKITLGMMVLASALTANASEISYKEAKNLFDQGEVVKMSDIPTINEAANGASVYKIDERIGKQSRQNQPLEGFGLVKVQRDYINMNSDKVEFTKEELLFCQLSSLNNCKAESTSTLNHGTSDSHVTSFKYFEATDGSLAGTTSKVADRVLVEYRKNQDQLIARVKIIKPSGKLLQAPTYTIHSK